MEVSTPHQAGEQRFGPLPDHESAFTAGAAVSEAAIGNLLMEKKPQTGSMTVGAGI